MQRIKNIIEDQSENIIKILLAVILFLILSLLFTGFKGKDKEDSVSENNMVEELLLDQDTDVIEGERIKSSNLEEAREVLPEKIIVDVKGAVEAPGVYEMDLDSRVIDCIEKSGGFLVEAEQKSVNLAQRAEDQMVIYIPLKGEDPAEFEYLLPAKAVTESSTITSKIDLNKATKEELKTLNGIGEVKAESIVAYREENGFFQNIEEITKVSGIGEATFEKLKEDIQVTP